MLRSIDVAAHAGTAFDGKWNAAASRNDSVERHQIVEIVELEGTNLLDHGRETPPRTAAALSGPVRRRSLAWLSWPRRTLSRLALATS